MRGELFNSLMFIVVVYLFDAFRYRQMLQLHEQGILS